MDTGRHQRASDCESTFDTARKRWAASVAGLNVASGEALRLAVDEEHSSINPEGWALKTIKRAPRMIEKAKAYLVEKFNSGVTSGQKADPVQVAREVKSARGGEGQLLFQPNEWRTSKQISSFFSRSSALQRHHQAESDYDKTSEEDLQALESEHCLETLHETVLKEVGNPQHPIIIKKRNICELSKSRKLNILKVANLQSICSKLNLQVSGSQYRKQTFTVPLEDYASACSCRESVS